jgi:hypothetical protein
MVPLTEINSLRNRRFFALKLQVRKISVAAWGAPPVADPP